MIQTPSLPERSLAEVTEEVTERELAHMMVCRDRDCRKCANEDPPVKTARRYLAAS